MKNKNKKKGIFSYGLFKKNRKANLLPEEVLKVVIAVICIGFLIFLLVSLYSSLAGAQKKKFAEASMKDIISAEITRINNNGEFNSQGVSIPNPPGWFIFSFVGGDLKPNLCIGINCVCICESVTLDVFNWQKRQINKCDDTGSCAVVSNLKKFDKIKIEKNGVALFIKKINNEIELTKK
jgi:hypothetical protein